MGHRVGRGCRSEFEAAAVPGCKAGSQVMSDDRRTLPIAALAVLGAGLALGGCSSLNLPSFGGSAPEPAPPPTAAALPSKYAPEELIGRWGYTSYQNEADKARTITIARGQCKNSFFCVYGACLVWVWFFFCF